MLATLGSLAALSPGTTWRLEGKWDGVRAVATVDGGDLLLRSRTDREMTATYPELAELPGLLAHCPVTLDGEIVAFDSDDRTDFGLLQQRQGLRGPAVERIRLGVPVTYLIFDVLTRHRIQRCDARRPGRQTRSVAHRPITGVGTVATRCCGPGRSLGATGDGR
jgi:bifunctional non-homologous end joining protein LigD